MYLEIFNFFVYLLSHGHYRLMIFRKSLLFTILAKYLADFSTHQYCHVKFTFKFFDEKVKKKRPSKNY